MSVYIYVFAMAGITRRKVIFLANQTDPSAYQTWGNYRYPLGKIIVYRILGTVMPWRNILHTCIAEYKIGTTVRFWACQACQDIKLPLIVASKAGAMLQELGKC